MENGLARVLVLVIAGNLISISNFKESTANLDLMLVASLLYLA